MENLTCVKCTSVLDKANLGSLEVDLCPSCGGLWLDRGELDQLAKRPAAELTSLKNALAGTAKPETSETSAHCPACTKALKEVKLGNINVEICTGCRGLFLDKGELDAALLTVKTADSDALLGMIAAVATTS